MSVSLATFLNANSQEFQSLFENKLKAQARYFPCLYIFLCVSMGSNKSIVQTSE